MLKMSVFSVKDIPKTRLIFDHPARLPRHPQEILGRSHGLFDVFPFEKNKEQEGWNAAVPQSRNRQEIFRSHTA